MSALLDTLEPAAAAADGARAPWTALTRVGFRFSFLYLGLYVLTTQMLGGIIVVPGEWSLPELETLPPLRTLISWTARHVFGVSRPLVITGSGSGDKTFDWVAAFCLMAIALAGTLTWSLIDRRRESYVSAHKWFRLFLRFAAGSTMLSYGMIKAIPLQMPAPPLTRLLEPFGNFSPMGVLWYSIGAAHGYERFAGFAELAAAVLLFIPGTATLGALFLLADAVQIFTLNMTYDVPVKLFSFHLIVIALVLLAPDAKRLLNVVVLNRTALPSSLPPLVYGRRARRVLLAAQLVFGAYLFVIFIMSSQQRWKSSGGGAPKPALYGIWNVEKMTIDGVERAPLVTDYDRWRRVVVQVSTALIFQRMDDTFAGYEATIDERRNTITLTKATDPFWKSELTFERKDLDHMALAGSMDGHRIHLQLQRVDHTKMQLLSRGFHWIQEYPFNR